MKELEKKNLIDNSLLTVSGKSVKYNLIDVKNYDKELKMFSEEFNDTDSIPFSVSRLRKTPMSISI